MPKHLEIERKFLLKRLPKGWKHCKSSQIFQGYFPMASKGLEIRLRQKGSRHFVTIKSGRGRQRVEEEVRIPEAMFRSLWPLTRGARIAKRRYNIPCNGNIIEMDVYQGPHRGLVTADIEFDSERQSRQFKKVEWLGREITGRRRYANEALARCQRLPLKPKRI
jgi:CYTH domain-containing protein